LIRIGTSGSKLALAQAEKVRHLLQAQDVAASVQIISASDDMDAESPLYRMNGFGAFVRETDYHLLKGAIDVAVHNFRDVPLQMPGGLVTAAVLKRGSALDVVITRDGKRLADLPKGSVVGTSSTLRSALVRRHYRGLVTRDVSGNVYTRLRKLKEGDYDAIILAEDGLIHLGINMDVERFDPCTFIPAPNQGVIAVLTREGSPEADIVKQLNDEDTWITTMVERIIAGSLDGEYAVPMGAYATREGEGLDVVCGVLSLDGRQQARVRETIPVNGYEEFARRIADRLALSGGLALAEEARKELIK